MCTHTTCCGRPPRGDTSIVIIASNWRGGDRRVLPYSRLRAYTRVKDFYVSFYFHLAHATLYISNVYVTIYMSTFVTMLMSTSGVPINPSVASGVWHRGINGYMCAMIHHGDDARLTRDWRLVIV